MKISQKYQSNLERMCILQSVEKKIEKNPEDKNLAVLWRAIRYDEEITKEQCDEIEAIFNEYLKGEL